MNKIEKWSDTVRTWAVSNPKIQSVHFVGSYIKGTQNDKSDLDIAITLCAPYGYTEWFFESDVWARELDAEIEVKVHLLRGGASLPNPVVERAVSEHGVLVFERAAPHKEGQKPTLAPNQPEKPI